MPLINALFKKINAYLTTTRRQATENTLILFQIIQEIKIIMSFVTDAKERTHTPKLFKQKQNHLKRAQKTNFTHKHKTQIDTHRNIHFNNTQRPTICSQP